MRRGGSEEFKRLRAWAHASVEEDVRERLERMGSSVGRV
jgi:hypothetical protein